MSALPHASAHAGSAPPAPPAHAGGTPAPPATRPRLRVVPRQQPVRRLVGLLIAVGAAGIFGVVGLSALAAESAFAAHELEAEIQGLSFRYDELTAEVARLESPARIRGEARDTLGMVPAQRPAYLVLETPVEFTSSVGDDVLQPTVSDPVKHARGEDEPESG